MSALGNNRKNLAEIEANNRERGRKIWQFIFLMAVMAILPVALIFLSYYKLPVSIAASEAENLVAYSSFLRNQKMVVAKMNLIDSNIRLYAEAKVENPKLLDQRILNGLNDLEHMDTSITMIKTAKANLENHYTHVTKLVEMQARASKAEKELQDLKDNLRNMGGGMMGNNAPIIPMPPGE